MRQVMPARRPQLAELGMFLLVVALPLVFTPFSASPFGDPKVVLLASGTLALWASGLPIDRPLGLAAAAWVGVTIVAAATGVDPSVGFTARTEGQGGGVILIACAGVLAVLGVGLPNDLRERGRRWIVVSAAIVGALGLAVRAAPDLGRSLPSDIELIGATLGNQLFAAAFVSAAIAAAIGASATAGSDVRSGETQDDRSPLLRLMRTSPRTVALVGFLALGAATFGERSSLVLPIIAAAAALWRARLGARTTLVLATAVVVPLLVWQLLDASVFPDTTGRGGVVTGISAQGTDLQRLTVWRTMARGATERPVLGWGPGSARSAFLAVATPADIEEAGRLWADAHNLFIETGVTSGVLGLATLAWLVWSLIVRSFRAARDRAWAFGAAAGLAAYSIVEPVGLVLTPLMFLLAGVAAGRSPTDAVGVETESGESREAGRALSIGVTAGLVVATIISLQMLSAASLERWGRVYGEPWAFERALQIQPWRLSSAERLGLRWALDGRAGDEAAGERARDVIAEAVRDHPWDGDVHLWASDIETLLRDEVAARAWIDQHLERFPGDAVAIAEAAREDDQGAAENPLPGT